LTQPDGTAVPARALADMNKLHLRRNSVTGAIDALPWYGKAIELNAELHANN
jgi:2,3,4,5-tetrahydropyridine-2,6-dicarboxylate N-succinyltransferase